MIPRVEVVMAVVTCEPMARSKWRRGREQTTRGEGNGLTKAGTRVAIKAPPFTERGALLLVAECVHPLANSTSGPLL